jgi:hypothetical protein
MGVVGGRIGRQDGRRALPVGVWGGSSGPTYAQFQAHIATLATDGAIAWTNSGGYALGSYRTTATPAPVGDMYGTSWLSEFNRSLSRVSRTVQHGLPSQAVLNAQVSASREIFIKYEAGAFVASPPLNRNGYLSQDSPSAGTLVTDLIYWDGAQAQRMNPSAGTGPTPYTW